MLYWEEYYYIGNNYIGFLFCFFSFRELGLSWRNLTAKTSSFEISICFAVLLGKRFVRSRAQIIVLPEKPAEVS